MFKLSHLTKLLCTLATLFLITMSYAQGRSGDAPGHTGIPNNSNGKGPKPHGLVAGTNDYGNATILTPTAFTSDESFAFFDGGGSVKQSYGTTPDGVMQFGGGYVNRGSRISAVGFVSVNDVSKFSNFSYNVIVSKSIGTNDAISAGALHQFANAAKTDAPASYYVAASHASKAVKSPGNPVITYTLGYGNGRFLEKMSYDYAAGRGSRGTGVFGSVSYAVVKQARLNAEWTGTNLAISSAITVKSNLPSLYIGVADITRYSGDKPVFVVGIGKAFGLK